jgi:hypothetical protein
LMMRNSLRICHSLWRYRNFCFYSVINRWNMFMIMTFMVLFAMSQNMFMRQISGFEENRTLCAVSSEPTLEPFCKKNESGCRMGHLLSPPPLFFLFSSSSSLLW